jgi:hypothetical protein
MSTGAVSLTTYMWDLRAQMEAGLRVLTELQRLLEDEGDEGVMRTPPLRDRLLEGLRELEASNGHVREVIAEAATVAASPLLPAPPTVSDRHSQT